MSTKSGVRRRFKNGVDSIMKSQSTIITAMITMGIAMAALTAYTVWFAAEGANLHGKPLTLSVLEVTDATILRNTVLLDADVTCTNPVSMGCIPSMDLLTVGVLNVTDTLISNTTNLIGETTCSLAVNPSCIPTDLVFNSIVVTNLTAHDFTHVNIMDLNETFINTETMNVVNALTCSTPNVIEQTCFDISNKQCLGGEININCIPEIPTDKFANNSISGDVIVDNSITSTQIQDGTITNVNMAPDSITTVNIVDGTVTGTDIASETITNINIANHTITALQIAMGTITSNEIATNTVTSSNILDNTITENDIAFNTITTANIKNRTIVGEDIAQNTITSYEIAPNTITGNNIQDDTITAADILMHTITNNEIDYNTILGSNIKNGTITTDDIADGQITDAKIVGMDINKLDCSVNKLDNSCLPTTVIVDQLIANNISAIDFTHVNMMEVNHTIFTAEQLTTDNLILNNAMTCDVAGEINVGCLPDITTNEILDLTIVNADINAMADILGSKLKDGSVDGDKITGGTLVTGHFTTGTLNGGVITDNTIGTDQIDSSIVNANIAGSAGITGGKLATGAISPTQLATDAVTTIKIANDAVTSVKIDDLTIIGAAAGNGMGNIAADTITGWNIKEGSIWGANSGGSGEGTSLIKAGTIGDVDIALDTIEGGAIAMSGNIAADTIHNYNIASNADIVGSKLKDLTIGVGKLYCPPGGTHINAECLPPAAAPVIGFNTITGGVNIATSHIQQQTIEGGEGVMNLLGNIAENTVTGWNIRDGTIEHVDMYNGVTEAKQLRGQIFYKGMMDIYKIVGDSIGLKTITGAVPPPILGGLITSGNIGHQTVTGGATPYVETGTLPTSNIGVETITGGTNTMVTERGNIAPNTITDYNIKDNAAIAGSKIADLGITNAKLAGSIESSKLLCDVQIGSVCLGSGPSKFNFYVYHRPTVMFPGGQMANYWADYHTSTAVTVPNTGNYMIFYKTLYFSNGYINDQDDQYCGVAINNVNDPTTIELAQSNNAGLFEQRFRHMMSIRSLNAGDVVKLQWQAVEGAFPINNPDLALITAYDMRFSVVEL